MLVLSSQNMYVCLMVALSQKMAANDRGFAQAGLKFRLPGSSARKETTF